MIFDSIMKLLTVQLLIYCLALLVVYEISNSYYNAITFS